MKRLSARCVLGLLILAVTGFVKSDLSQAAEPTSSLNLVRPTEVRTIRADGRHNAFTAFRRFKGSLFLAFRSAKDHNSQDGDIVVLKSVDNGKIWNEAFKLDVVPDDRDPQFLVTDKRLFLYDAAMRGTRYLSPSRSWKST